MINPIRLMKRRRELIRNQKGSMSVKEFVVFAVTVFLGALIGGWIVKWLNIGSGDIFSQILAFLIPTVAIYVLWKKLGMKMAK